MFELQENIDLKNWNLWFHESGTDINDPINKRNFAKLVNIMLSGDEKKPINIDSIWAMWNVTFIWEKGEEIYYADAKTNILDRLWASQKSVILWNMEKFKKPSEDKE
jgi:beta-xylosidase